MGHGFCYDGEKFGEHWRKEKGDDDGRPENAILQMVP
jgi:hypothetical protein